MDGSQFTGVQGFLAPVSVGRGRGVLGLPIPFPQLSASVGTTVGMAARTPRPVASDTPHAARTEQDDFLTHRGPCTSTPLTTGDLVGQMSGIVQQIGQQLADSILAHLNRSSPTAALSTPSVRSDSYTPAQDFVSSSQVQVVSQRKVRDPPTFRGENSDSVTLEEWIELMRTFIKKGSLSTEEQGEEILIHLRGKAKDVVKITDSVSSVSLLATQGTDVRIEDRVQHPVARCQTNRSACRGEPRRFFEAFSDYESLSQLYSSDCSSEKTVIFQNLQTVPRSDSLFYTSVSLVNGLSFKALIDSGSMACTLSESAEAMLQCIPGISMQSAHDIVIVGCGGHRVTPTAIYDLQVSVYGCSMTVPTLVVPGQSEEMILGTNVIKRLLTCLRETSGYWKLMSMPSNNQSDECSQFLSLFSNTERWRGESVPDRVGTVKLMRSVTLEPQTEHLVWGKLPVSSALSVGSTVIVEPTKSRSRPKQIMLFWKLTPVVVWVKSWV
ncbi:hypothetical protein N1851_026899 [Merluccius polli]|uniref:Uncharacterized protein n=1 Tax=Merluccius polli TaxID=89951 RepID=A0AA47MB60_MERPO|nr:hypothetical protein N1851_026899 [Merluccius polli]